MELLGVLERKVIKLVELVRKLQQEVIVLNQERAKLREQLDALEHSLLSRDQLNEERGQELLETKNVVNDMIRAIDILLEKELSADLSVDNSSKLESQQ